MKPCSRTTAVIGYTNMYIVEYTCSSLNSVSSAGALQRAVCITVRSAVTTIVMHVSHYRRMAPHYGWPREAGRGLCGAQFGGVRRAL